MVECELPNILDAASAIYDTEEDLRQSWKDKDAFLGAIARAAGTVVTLLNAVGIFKKSN